MYYVYAAPKGEVFEHSGLKEGKVWFSRFSTLANLYPLSNVYEITDFGLKRYRFQGSDSPPPPKTFPGGGVPYLCLFKIALWFICDSTGSQLYSLMHYFSFRDQYMSFNDLNRPQSGLSFFPTLSFAHSLPPLGEWCREVVRSRQWDRDIMVKENRNKSARRRLSRIPEVWVLTMMTKLKLLRIPSWQF